MLAGAALALAAALPPAPAGAQEPGGTRSAWDLASVTAIPLRCPDGAEERTLPWNVRGYSKGCYRQGVADGPVIFWEEGYLNLSGAFADGRKDGAWTVFHQDGTRYVTIHFRDGVKTGKTFHSSARGGVAGAGGR